MVAPSDPNGINRAGAPTQHDHTINNWGFIMGGTDRRRVLLGWVLFGGAFVGVLLLAFLLVRFGGNNKHAIEPAGFVRSAELDAPALTAAIKQHGIRSVVRLVGTEGRDAESYNEEARVCESMGVKHFVAKMAATRLPWRSELRRVFEVLDAIDSDPKLQPMLVHCSAGSDRTGLVSVIWMHDYRGVSYEEARMQLGWDRYMHIRFGDAGEMTDFLSRYEEYQRNNPRQRLSIQQWVKLHYFEEKPGAASQPWLDGNVYR